MRALTWLSATRPSLRTRPSAVRSNHRSPLKKAALNVSLMASWGVVDPGTAYDAGLEYPDESGEDAQFDDIWNFQVRVYEDWMERLESVCPGAYWLIQSTRYTHGDGTAAYIAFMVERMLEIRRILRPTGSVFLHCDHEADAYLRQMMDAVFGASKFQESDCLAKSGYQER